MIVTSIEEVRKQVEELQKDRVYIVKLPEEMINEETINNIVNLFEEKGISVILMPKDSEIDIFELLKN